MIPSLLERRPLSCTAVRALMPTLLDSRSSAPHVIVGHVEACLTCQAELARYRRLLRLLDSLSTDAVPLPAGTLGELLAGLQQAATRHVVRSALTNRRLLGGTLGLTVLVAASVGVLARLRRPRLSGAA